MKKFIEQYESNEKKYIQLKEYIKRYDLADHQEDYRKYKEIIYGSMINRIYNLWESHVKEIAYLLFCYKKSQYLEEKSIIRRYRLHELPSFLFEEGVFCEEDETIKFSLSKDMITYTSKNIDCKELENLFTRFDIKIRGELEKSSFINQKIDELSLPLEGLDRSKILRSLKRIISERNVIAHGQTVDTYEDLKMLINWTDYMMLLSAFFTRHVLSEIIDIKTLNCQSIGKFVSVAYDDIACVNIQNVSFKKGEYIYIIKDEKIIDIAEIISMQVKQNERQEVFHKDHAGIKLCSLFKMNIKLKTDLELRCISQMRYQWILEEAKKFPGSEVLYKEEWQAYCFFIGGKLFGYLGTNKENESIVTLKGNPAMNQELRESFDFIIPGYYMNKVHWISVKLESKDAQPNLIIPLIKKSYELIFSSLPKKTQVQISV